MAELADASDLKSEAYGVWVRVPPGAPKENNMEWETFRSLYADLVNSKYLMLAAYITGVSILLWAMYCVITPPKARFLPGRRGMAKTKKERDDYVKRLLSDGIVEMLLEAEVRGDMTSDEVAKWYRIFATRCHIPDLMPRARAKHAAVLKAEIRERLNSGFYRQKINLPGETPQRKRISIAAMLSSAN